MNERMMPRRGHYEGVTSLFVSHVLPDDDHMGMGTNSGWERMQGLAQGVLWHVSGVNRDRVQYEMYAQSVKSYDKPRSQFDDREMLYE